MQNPLNILQKDYLYALYFIVSKNTVKKAKSLLFQTLSCYICSWNMCITKSVNQNVPKIKKKLITLLISVYRNKYNPGN